MSATLSTAASPSEPGSRLGFFAALFGACFALSLARDPAALTLPVLMVEDARFLFGFYYQHRDPASIFRFYFGYVSLVPNLVGYLAFFLPTPFVPHLFVLFPLLASSAAFSCFFASGFRSLVPSDAARFAICLVLAAAPLGDALLIGNTMYSIWSLLLLLSLCSLLPLRAGASVGAGWLVLRGFVMSLMACSHPAAILLLPIWLASALRERSRRAFFFYGGLIAVMLAYFVWGVRPGELAMPNPIDALAATAVLVAERVAGVALLGVEGGRVASRSALGVALLWTSLVALALLLWGWLSGLQKRTAQQSFQLIAVAYLIVALTGLAWLTREAGSHEIGDRLRYFWLQRELYLVLFFSAATAFSCARSSGWLSARGSRAVVVLLLVGWLGCLNYFDNWRYQVRRTAGYQVESFIADVVRQEAIHGDRSQISARLDRGPFSIALGDEARRKSR